MPLNRKPMILYGSLFDDNPVIANERADGFPAEWAVNDLVYQWWKAAAFGTAEIIVDTGSGSTAADCLGIAVHNLGPDSADADIRILTGAGLSLSDAFDNASLDPANFGTSTGGSGTVTEGAELVIASTGHGDAALIYDKNPLKGRAIPYTLRHSFDTTPTAGINSKMLVMGLWQDSSVPAVKTGVTAADDLLTVMIYARELDGDCLFYFAYQDTAGDWHYWDGAAWQATEASCYTGVLGTAYIARIVNDGTGPDLQLWDSADAVEHASARPLWGSIIDSRVPEYVTWGDPSTDSAITEAELQIFHQDDFDNSSLDAALWGTSTDAGSGSASVAETTSLAIETLSNVDAAALVYYKELLNPRASRPWKIRNTCETLNQDPGGNMTMLMLFQDSIAPATDTAANIQGKALGDIYQASNGDIYIRHWDSGGTAQYWDGAAWTPTPTPAINGDVDIVYTVEAYNDLTNLAFRIYGSAGTLQESASIAWASVRAEANSLYALFGDPYDDDDYGKLVSSGFVHSAEGYRGTINSQLYTHTGEGGSYTEKLAAFTPDSDLAFLREFTEATGRYWKLEIETAAVIPYIGFLKIGSKLNIQRYLQDGFDPQPEQVGNVVGRAQAGGFLGVVRKPVKLPITIPLGNLTDTWLEYTWRPAWDAHIGIGRPFFWAWDNTNHGEQCFVVSVPGGITWGAPFTQSRRQTNIPITGIKGI